MTSPLTCDLEFLICELVRDFSPIYVTTPITKHQKTDICNGVQVIVRTDTYTHTIMHVFVIVRQSGQI